MYRVCYYDAQYRRYGLGWNLIADGVPIWRREMCAPAAHRPFWTIWLTSELVNRLFRNSQVGGPLLYVLNKESVQYTGKASQAQTVGTSATVRTPSGKATPSPLSRTAVKLISATAAEGVLRDMRCQPVLDGCCSSLRQPSADVDAELGCSALSMLQAKRRQDEIALMVAKTAMQEFQPRMLPLHVILFPARAPLENIDTVSHRSSRYSARNCCSATPT